MQRTCLALIAALLIAPTICLGQTLSEFIQEEESQPWDISVESTYLRPSINGGVHSEPNYNLYEAPRLHFRNLIKEFPIEISLWHMNTRDNIATSYISYGYFHDSAFSFNQLEAGTLDIKTSHRFQLGESNHKISYGLRSSFLSTNLNTLGFGSILGRHVSQSSDESYGAGFTCGIEGKFPLVNQSNLNFFYHIGGSYLYSTNSSTSTAQNGELITGALNRPINGRSYLQASNANYDPDSGILTESRIGIEWNYLFANKNKYANIRLMLENQSWNIDLNSIGPISPIIYTNALDNGDFSDEFFELVGLSLTAEVTY